VRPAGRRARVLGSGVLKDHPTSGDRLTICLASRALSPATHSGVARATRELASALAGRGHSVHVITRSLDADGLRLGGAMVHAVGAPAPRVRSAALDQLAHAAAVHRTVAEIHEREGVDVVVTPLWGCEGMVCMLDDRFPTVVSCMTSMKTIQELRGGAVAGEEAELIALERAVMSRARWVHGLTRSALDKTLADYDASPVGSEIVGRGLADRGGRDGGPGRRRDGPPEILFVGRLERRKGVSVLLDAARRLAAEGTEFSLVLAGPDSGDTETGEPYRAAFERGTDGQSPPGRVRFAGAVSDDELEDLYGRADVVCVPSRYESHGVVLVEAMMFGKPIVACRAGGVPEVVEEGGNALLAAPGDVDSLAGSLRRVIVDEELRRRLGARSRSLYSERFEAGAAGAAMEGFLGRVSAAHPRVGAASSDLAGRLAAVVEEVLALDGGAAAATAGELLSPPPEAWGAAALEAERDREAWRARALEAERQVGEWRARALEAERQREAGEAALASVSSSRWWRLTAPLRRLTYALRNRT
jgi:glycosyltransferase involved in cell wall biosynthesis